MVHGNIPITSEYAMKCRINIAIIEDPVRLLEHHAAENAASKCSDTDVANIVDLFETIYIDPFDLQ